jgi:hypothetical protein
MKFKTEVFLLSLALILFAVSAFFYSYQTGGSNFSLNWASYPYQGYALAFVSLGSVLTVTASVSYSKRGKNMLHEDFDYSAEDKSN